ncbi:hypothetical protein DAPPUDRAFT_251174 [Daphnia pulex]|uniref:Uncharacterized protein n=1 Tax=Daphnia pulex TaxID=6669 RepID=E9GZW1_DAPPU|nr:hypothetical protein DAPPUDRAFT_251174 [Daphnia pulex]|eukprot:EFX74986.1 hypothetical protein DAPPUDRAFT_251174 [Daphnia pulex]
MDTGHRFRGNWYYFTSFGSKHHGVLWSGKSYASSVSHSIRILFHPVFLKMSSVTLKMDIKVLESDFEKDLELKNNIEKLLKDAKHIQQLKNSSYTQSSQRLNRQLKNLRLCARKLKKNTPEVVMAMVHSSFCVIMKVEPPTNPQLLTAIKPQGNQAGITLKVAIHPTSRMFKCEVCKKSFMNLLV